ncbi:MAG: IS701 family transposase, partial [Polaromonas sp.]
MKKADLDLYTDYLLSTFGAATATGLSAMVDGDVSHDRITRFLSGQNYTSKDLWQQVKSTARKV